MSRPLLAGIFALIVLAAMWGERLPIAQPIRDEFREWLGAEEDPGETWKITEVSIDSSATGEIKPLDAALVLRATERFAPRLCVFLGPVGPEAEAGLFRSRLRDCRIPVVLTATQGAPALAGVRGGKLAEAVATPTAFAAAGWTMGAMMSPGAPGRVALLGRRGNSIVPATALQAALQVSGLPVGRTSGVAPGMITNAGWLSPLRADGTVGINPLASRHLLSVTLDEILLRVENSERGQIDASLDGLFRDRIVAAVPARGAAADGLALSAVCNELTEGSAPWWLAALAIGLVASLPWWAMERFLRVLWALAAAGSWLLVAMGIYEEFRIVPAWSVAVLLPLLAFAPVRRRLPPPSDDGQRGEAPA